MWPTSWQAIVEPGVLTGLFVLLNFRVQPLAVQASHNDLSPPWRLKRSSSLALSMKSFQLIKITLISSQQLAITSWPCMLCCMHFKMCACTCALIHVCYCVHNKPLLPGWSLHFSVQRVRPPAFVFPTVLPSTAHAIKHGMVPLWNSRLLWPKGFLMGYTGSILEPMFLPSGGFIFNLDLSWNLFSQPKAVAYTPCPRDGCRAGRTQRQQTESTQRRQKAAGLLK